MTKELPGLVLKNFGEASSNYNKEAKLQKDFAWQLAKKCSRESIPDGLWVDLGAGTGLLAEALEAVKPNQSVIRLDGSKQMLAKHPPDSKTQLWDLNLGLPKWNNKPTLLASNFALHWLENPTCRIKEWFSALAPGGLLAVALPVEGSFKEWYKAANAASVSCTAISLPSNHSLIEAFKPEQIRYQKVHKVLQNAPSVSSLLKPMIKVGAHASPTKSLSVGDWRRLQQLWPRSKWRNTIKLTWLIQLLLVQR